MKQSSVSFRIIPDTYKKHSESANLRHALFEEHETV